MCFSTDIATNTPRKINALDVPISDGIQSLRQNLDSNVLRRQLKEVRSRDYAVEIGENEDGAMCIGVPILDDLEYPVAALSLSAPEQRQTDELIKSAAKALLAAGRTIAQYMAGGLGF